MMIHDIFHILLWITVVILIVSGIDDSFIDLMYWINRKKYKNSLPGFSEIDGKPEKPIAIMIGAWKEYKVIGRTLTLALNKIKYSNYRIFVGVYPNDLKTVKVVRDIARKDKRVILCLNIIDGPTTKADNLNNLYSCLKEYEISNGLFEIVLIHDSEDFIHPLSLKLFNYFIAYKGYYGIQIPVIPIKSKYGRFFHRTYCDAFAELHSKDLIVRQSLGSFVPFAGTGMGFNRNAFFYLETQDEKYAQKNIQSNQSLNSDENIYSRKSLNEILSSLDQDLETQETNINSELRYSNGQMEDNSSRKEIKKKVPFNPLLLLSVILILTAVILFKSGNVSSNSIARSSVLKVINKQIPEGQKIELIDNNNLVSHLPEFKVEFIDQQLKIAYLKSEDGNFVILESSWNVESDALARADLVNAQFTNAVVYVNQNKTNNGDANYQVILGNYSTLAEAKLQAFELRKLKN